MGQADIYFDPAGLGYGYDVTEADRLPRPEEVVALVTSADGSPIRFGSSPKSRHARLSGDGLHDPLMAEPTWITSVVVNVPAESSEAQVAFSRPHGSPDVSFTIDLYLHPADLSFDPKDQASRAKYIVVALGYWGSSESSVHGEHSPDKPLFADLTDTLADLAATGHGGETWTLTAVVSGQLPSPEFGTLSLVP